VVYYLGDDGSQFDQRLRPRYPMVIEGVVSSSGRTQEGVELLIVTHGNELPGLNTYPVTWLIHAAPEDQPMIEHLAQSFLGGTDPTVMFDVRRMDQQGEIKPVLDQQKTTSHILSVIILGVAAIGVVSTGLSNIRERAQEFGIRRAIGVTTKSVFAGVVMQTLIEATMAAVAALVLSAIVVATLGERLVLVDIELLSKPTLPLASAGQGVLAAIVVGLVSSLLPAFRAARYSVAEVIRA
jgi:ABC-type antimicrobial peptide transport system permease subunit